MFQIIVTVVATLSYQRLPCVAAVESTYAFTMVCATGSNRHVHDVCHLHGVSIVMDDPVDDACSNGEVIGSVMLNCANAGQLLLSNGGTSDFVGVAGTLDGASVIGVVVAGVSVDGNCVVSAASVVVAGANEPATACEESQTYE